MATQVATKYDVGGVLLDRPFKIRRLGHFGLNLTNFEEGLRLYRDLLGFRVSDTGAAGYFMRYGSDHHALNLADKKERDARAAADPAGRRYSKPDITTNQITWQTQSLTEPVKAVDYFAERGIPLQRTGRDGAGSNWATYFYDPDGHTNELYYGIEQIGWDGLSKPAEYRRPVRETVKLPVPSEFEEIQESMATTGVALNTGHRYVELPSEYEVDGILLPRPFKIVKHGPVNLFVENVDQARAFYEGELGFVVTEESVWQGERCLFLRCSTEHHSLGLFPIAWRERLGLSSHTTIMSFGLQVANYRQLREAVDFLRQNGVRVETNLIPPELYPGIDYTAHAFDPDGHCLQLYYYMEQVGWDGKPRPAHLRPKVDNTNWPDTVAGQSDSYAGEVYLGPWG